MTDRFRGLVLGAALLPVVLGSPAIAPAGQEGANTEAVSLPSTLVTEGATPATELEASFTTSHSRTEKQYGFGLNSLQYAPVPSVGLKLVIPFLFRDPRDPAPDSVGGISDVSVMVKYAPVLLPEHRFAFSGGLRLTFPTGSEERELGGQFAVSPFLAAGKAWGALSFQADVFYSWQVNRPRRVPPEEEGAEPLFPDKAQVVTANLSGIFSPLEWLSVILELNSVTLLKGDEELKERLQLYLTPGLGVEPAKGWNLRGGIQLPATSAKTFEYNVILILTKGF
jgi:hypothetical protein